MVKIRMYGGFIFLDCVNMKLIIRWIVFGLWGEFLISLIVRDSL